MPFQYELDKIPSMTISDNVILFCHNDEFKEEPFHLFNFKSFDKTGRGNVFEDFGSLELSERLDPFYKSFKEKGQYRREIYCMFSKAQSGNIMIVLF